VVRVFRKVIITQYEAKKGNDCKNVLKPISLTPNILI